MSHFFSWLAAQLQPVAPAPIAIGEAEILAQLPAIAGLEARGC